MIYRRMLFCFAALFATTANGFAAEVYGQLSSLKTQLPDRGPQVVSLESADGVSGMDYISATKLGVKEGGVYYIMVSAQAGADQSTEAAGGYVDLWLIRNGKPIANSNSTTYIYLKQSTVTLVCQVIMPVSAGDTLGVGFSSTKPGMGLIATEGPTGEPLISSISFSTFKLPLTAPTAKR